MRYSLPENNFSFAVTGPIPIRQSAFSAGATKQTLAITLKNKAARNFQDANNRDRII